MSSKGFTLVELLVSITIFIFMTALVISRYGAFNQGTLLTNLSYDVALAFRTAQTYGLSVKGNDAAGSQNFTAAYGIHMDLSNLTGNPPSSGKIYMFADNTPLDGVYGGADSLVQTYTLTHGAKISEICFGSDSASCITSAGGATPQVDITYRRPNPNAIVRYCPAGCGGIWQTSASPYTRIKISATDNSFRTIVIRENGQISVEE